MLGRLATTTATSWQWSTLWKNWSVQEGQTERSGGIGSQVNLFLGVERQKIGLEELMFVVRKAGWLV